LWIAEHPDLVGDIRLGRDQSQRFFPTRFNVAGDAVDVRGFPCHRPACPKCHLPVPRSLFEMPSVFMSILGAPSCGKSYLLTAMTWRLRNVLPKHFALSFSDADPYSNNRLQEYESLQFLNPNQDTLVAIEKTETHGDLYDTVLHGDQAVNFPRPFLFCITPLEAHPGFPTAETTSRALCLYDNAGESYLPGADTATSPVTRHLAMSRALLFLFDPTQDTRFRAACRGKTNDPQMVERSERLQRERPVRQETILTEAAHRVRRYAGLAHNVKHSRPLIVIVTKYDCWSSLLTGDRLDPPWRPISDGTLFALRNGLIEELSQGVRSLLGDLSPEVVAAAEGFSSEVIYIPVSSTGCSPEVDAQTGALGFRPKNINPMWAEVPPLYAMSRWMPGLVSYSNRRRMTGNSAHPQAAGGNHVPAGSPDSPRSNSVSKDRTQ
jgi:hypothetical protein